MHILNWPSLNIHLAKSSFFGAFKVLKFLEFYLLQVGLYVVDLVYGPRNLVLVVGKLKLGEVGVTYLLEQVRVVRVA